MGIKFDVCEPEYWLLMMKSQDSNNHRPETAGGVAQIGSDGQQHIAAIRDRTQVSMQKARLTTLLT